MRVLARVVLAAAALVTACASPTATPRTGSGTNPGADAAPAKTKAITIGVTGNVAALGIPGGSSPVGGWAAITEMHTDGLVTAERDVHKLTGRLAEQVPNLDDGTISVLPDGRMKVVFTLRKGITWHDGVPLTADDMVFSYKFGGPEGFPTTANDAAKIMSAVEAPDPQTFVVYYRQAYYLGASLGPLMFWPMPEHLLMDAWARYSESKNADDILRDPYWTSGYINSGAFRISEFNPGTGMEFQAYDGYYLGRPKIDQIHIRIFNDDSTLMSNILAGAVDLTPELALRQGVGVPLRDRWKTTGEGDVVVTDNAIRFLEPQMRPSVQMEPGVLDPRVRTALYYALDREALSDATNGGNPQLAAWSILPRVDPLVEVTRDTLRPFAYDPERTKAAMKDLGWTFGSDGVMRNEATGRPFRTSIWASLGSDEEIAAYAAYWRKVGLDVEEHISSAAESRDEGARAQFPSWEVASFDPINMMGKRAATLENRWAGNRNGLDDPQAQQLLTAFQMSLSRPEQLQTMKAVNEYFISQMLGLPTYFQAVWMARRKGVQAFDDISGGYGAHVGMNGFWGSYYRNAYQWDVQ